MKTIFLITTLLFMQHLSFSQEPPTLVYIGDPMCSWCYGFSPELEESIQTLGDKVQVRLIMGGLRPYNQEHINTMKDFLKEHWEHVHEASGQTFDYNILDDPDFMYDTEPPSRAVLVVRHLKPDVEMSFFKDVQELFYAQNKHTHIAANYYPLLDKYEIDRAAFDKAFESDDMKQLTRQDFEESSQLGIRGFPSVALFQDGKYTLISNGYTKSEVLVDRVNKVMQQ